MNVWEMVWYDYKADTRDRVDMIRKDIREMGFSGWEVVVYD
jgi:hypothetical protein